MTASVRWARSSLADRPLRALSHRARGRPSGARRQDRTGPMTDMTKCRGDEPAKLLARQRALQTEAADVRAQLALLRCSALSATLSSSEAVALAGPGLEARGIMGN